MLEDKEFLKECHLQQLQQHSELIIEALEAQNIIEIPNQPVIVTLTSQYRQFMKFENQQDNFDYHPYLLELAKKQILLTNKPYNYFSISYEPKCKNFEVIQARIGMGKASFSLTILNVVGPCPFAKLTPFNQGNQGEVHLINHNNEQFVIKAYPIKNEFTKKMTIREGIKQYCLLKFASELQCGPFTRKYLGFDIIVYHNRLIFAMEKVQMITNITEKQEEELKQDLKLMHRFKFIHYDIKPQNFCYSNHFRKAVFLDFGLSSFIKEDIGEKTYTYFKGSFSYCGQQMLKLFSSNHTHANVDLYYNDVVCLSKSFLFLKTQEAKTQSIIAQNLEEPQKQESEEKQNYLQSLEQHDQDSFTQIQIFDLHLRYNLIYVRQNQLVAMLSNIPIRYTKIRSFLQFVKRNHKFSYLSNDFLNLIKHYPEYEELSNNTFRISHKIDNFDDCNLYVGDEGDEMMTQFHNRYDLLSGFIRLDQPQQAQLECLKKNKVNFVKNSRGPLKDLRSLHSFLDCFIDIIRFDTSRFNMTLLEKHKLFGSFKRNIDPKYNQDRTPIQDLQYAFKFILAHCINQPLHPWKVKNLFLVLQQCIYLDADFYRFLPRINMMLFRQDLKISDKVLFHIEADRLEVLCYFKKLSAYKKKYTEMIRYLLSLKDKLKERVMDSIKQCQTLEQRRIQFIYLACQAQSTKQAKQRHQIFKQKMLEVQLLSNIEIGQKLKDMFMFHQLQQTSKAVSIECFYALSRYFKTRTSWKSQKIGIQMELYLRSIKDKYDIYLNKNIYAKIKKIINCNQIVDQLKINYFQFLRERPFKSENLHQTILNFQKSVYVGEIEYLQFLKIIKSNKLLIKSGYLETYLSIDIHDKMDLSSQLNRFQVWNENDFLNFTYLVFLYLPEKSSEQQEYEFIRKLELIHKNNKQYHEQDRLLLLKHRLIKHMLKAAYFQSKKHILQAYQYQTSVFQMASYLEYYVIEINSRIKANTYVMHLFYLNNALHKNIMLQSFTSFYQYTQARGYYLIYFKFKKFILMALLTLLEKDRNQKEFKIFMEKIIYHVSIFQSPLYVDEFLESINCFYHQRPNFFTKEILTTLYPQINKEMCYTVFLYLLYLVKNKDLSVLHRVGKGLIYVESYGRTKLIKRYLQEVEKTLELQERKKEKIEIRFGIRYKSNVKIQNLPILQHLQRRKGQSIQNKYLYLNLRKYLLISASND